MKSILQQISSISLSLLVLLSTVSWSVDMHYCMGRLVDMSFFAEAETCGMEEALSRQGIAAEHSCCDDQTLTVAAQDDLLNSSFDLDLQPQVFLSGFAFSLLQVVEDYPKVIPSIATPPPPLLEQDLQVLYETFLI